MKNQAKAVLFGVAIGDALGVPVEFKDRELLEKNPVTDMFGHGTHNQPPGTWSDDSSLTFCLAENLCQGYDLQDLANRFIKWREHSYWTPHGKVFDIGIATSKAIRYLSNGVSPIFGGGTDENSNGNGSLMRILPLAFYVKNLPVEARFDCIKQVSSLTHAHIRSLLACFIYLEMALEIMQGKEKMQAFENTKNTGVGQVCNEN
jgi:ADP-ribosyl-[dinitrogen reductase] hydrolase